MADQAVGRNCPNDGTLTACAGSYTDEFLVGTCVVCKKIISTPNPYYRKPADEDGPEEIASEQQAASIHNYNDVTPDPEPPSPPPVAEEPESSDDEPLAFNPSPILPTVPNEDA